MTVYLKQLSWNWYTLCVNVVYKEEDVVILYIDLIKTLEKSLNLIIFFLQVFCKLPLKKEAVL